MPRGSSPKRELQYEHIKDSDKKRGESTARAEEIAARTGGLRSHRGAGGPTKAQLYAEASRRGVKGRSKMTKAQLARAVGS